MSQHIIFSSSSIKAPHLPKTNTPGEGALLLRRHRGSQAVCFSWSSSKGPTDLALAGVCVCVCLLKKQQGKCQTSILQLGKGGGGAALAAHLGNIGWVVFFFFLSIKNCSQASLECQISAVFLRNASSSGQSMESGLAYTWWGHCTRLCVSIPGLVQPDAFQLAFVMGKTCR